MVKPAAASATDSMSETSAQPALVAYADMGEARAGGMMVGGAGQRRQLGALY